jgi:hypothetical protein
MPNIIPKTFTLIDGWYWAGPEKTVGPFPSEDEALNDYVDSHICEEE